MVVVKPQPQQCVGWVAYVDLAVANIWTPVQVLQSVKPMLSTLAVTLSRRVSK
jgi:hypothetical protein